MRTIKSPLHASVMMMSLLVHGARAQWIACMNGSTTCTNQFVGIGTTNPNRNLVVSGSSTSTLQLSTMGAGATCCDGFQFQQVGNDTHLINEQNGFISFWTSANRRMTIDSNGSIGIGTTTPTSSFALDVVGSGFAVRINSLYEALRAFSTDGTAIRASGYHNGTGVLTGGYGINAFGSGTGGVGVYAGGSDPNTIGVYGYSTGGGGVGVWGYSNAGSIGVFGKSAPVGTGSYAGSFDGNVKITGSLSKGGGSFKIDHPVDPANKYLYHSFVESPDMMNIYNGNVVLDGNGEAVVPLPDWFEALNQDFRYQLTSIGAPGPNLYIGEEVQGNQFKIAGGKPAAKVSWQVTGIRHDAWANAHRIPVEEEKPDAERGLYLYPKEQGQPEALGVDWKITQALEQGMQKRVR